MAVSSELCLPHPSHFREGHASVFTLHSHLKESSYNFLKAALHDSLPPGSDGQHNSLYTCTYMYTHADTTRGGSLLSSSTATGEDRPMGSSDIKPAHRSSIIFSSQFPCAALPWQQFFPFIVPLPPRTILGCLLALETRLCSLAPFKH